MESTMKKELNKTIDETFEKCTNGAINRRDFLRFLGVAGAAAGLVGGPFGLLRRPAWAAESIRFDSWGGTVSEAFRKYAFDPFTQSTGIKIIDDEFGHFGDTDDYFTLVKASIPPGDKFNLAHLSGAFDYARYVRLGLNEILDESKIPNLDNVMISMIETYRGLTGGKLSAVPYDYGQTGVAYNTKFISRDKAEKLGASLLWDRDLSGKLGSWGDWRTCIWYAALHTKQHPNKIEDIEAVWDALKKLRKMIKTYWYSGAELMSLLANEEIYATVAWSGRVAALQDQGYPIGFLSPHNCYSWQECIFVLKGTDLNIAYKLLDFMLEPEYAFAVAEGQKYPPSLDPTKVLMPDTIKKLPAFDPTGKLDGYLFADPAYWNSHHIEWSEKWRRIKAGGYFQS